MALENPARRGRRPGTDADRAADRPTGDVDDREARPDLLGRIAAPLVTWTGHENDRFVSAVENGPLWATQFHPEKSGDAGLALLRNWTATLR